MLFIAHCACASKSVKGSDSVGARRQHSIFDLDTTRRANPTCTSLAGACGACWNFSLRGIAFGLLALNSYSLRYGRVSICSRFSQQLIELCRNSEVHRPGIILSFNALLDCA